jgi:hypothetical protein
MERLDEHFKCRMTEADCLALLSMSTEVSIHSLLLGFILLLIAVSGQFNQLQVRDNEVEELKNLMNNVIPCQVKVCLVISFDGSRSDRSRLFRVGRILRRERLTFCQSCFDVCLYICR